MSVQAWLRIPTGDKIFFWTSSLTNENPLSIVFCIPAAAAAAAAVSVGSFYIYVCEQRRREIEDAFDDVAVNVYDHNRLDIV